MRIGQAALAYWALIFALGFVLGTVRVLWGAAALGETNFLLLEVPAMLLASWLVARQLVARFAVARTGPALAMGALALALLLAAELALGVIGFGQSPREWLADLLRAPGIYGLISQLGFALMPWLAAKRRG